MALLLATLLAACQSDGIVPPDQMQISVSNEASIKVELVVNGKFIRAIDPTSHVDVHASELPPLPWAAEVRVPGGRSLLSLPIRAGDVWSKAVANGGTEMRGDGARVDLSCGRIDIYSGPPLMGPAPGAGTAGDCDP